MFSRRHIDWSALKILNFARAVQGNEAKWPKTLRSSDTPAIYRQLRGFADILDVGCAGNRCFKHR